ncbi:MAG: ribbon-helix-helix protein, CopG family [Xanthobacteraceae bacterium]
MASRTVKSVTISLPAEMVDELDRVRKREHRSRSEFLPEAFRQYVDGGPERKIPIVDPEPEELDALESGRQQTERGEYVLLKELLGGLDPGRSP